MADNKINITVNFSAQNSVSVSSRIVGTSRISVSVVLSKITAVVRAVERETVRITAQFVKPWKVTVTVNVKLVQIASLSCLPVSIMNQFFAEIASIASGGSYNVVQLTQLVDNEDLNTTTVIDTI